MPKIRYTFTLADQNGENERELYLDSPFPFVDPIGTAFYFGLDTLQEFLVVGGHASFPHDGLFEIELVRESGGTKVNAKDEKTLDLLLENGWYE